MSTESPDLAVAEEEVERADGPAEARQFILDFCAEHPDALYRTCLEGHLTGSALVVDPATRRILLIHHAKLGRWLQPGGHADGEGDLGRVALREAREETGLTSLELVRPAIDLDVHRIPARGAEPSHVHLDVRYLVLGSEADGATGFDDREVLDMVWVTDDDPRISDDMARLVSAGLQRLDDASE